MRCRNRAKSRAACTGQWPVQTKQPGSPLRKRAHQLSRHIRVNGPRETKCANQIEAFTGRALWCRPAETPINTPGRGPGTGYVPDTSTPHRHRSDGGATDTKGRPRQAPDQADTRHVNAPEHAERGTRLLLSNRCLGETGPWRDRSDTNDTVSVPQERVPEIPKNHEG